MVLHLQERRINVLRAVAEEVERGHQKDRVDGKRPMFLQHREQRSRARMIRGTSPAIQAHAADVKNEKRRDDARP